MENANEEIASGVQLAVDAVGGNQSELARRLTVTPQAVNHWLRNGKVPPGAALRVHEITGVPLHLLNPSIFRAPTPAA
jgi:DNA-binding transcriptional regulator YdaS (Cro superfamily)